MNSPKYPFYIVSKGRWETRLTSKALDRMGVFHYMVVEEQEYDSYCSVMPKEQVLILDTQYQIDYDTFDDLVIIGVPVDTTFIDLIITLKIYV